MGSVASLYSKVNPIKEDKNSFEELSPEVKDWYIVNPENSNGPRPLINQEARRQAMEKIIKLENSRNIMEKASEIFQKCLQKTEIKQGTNCSTN